MKTSQLVDALASGLDSVDHRAIDRLLLLAILASATAACGFGLFFLGARSNIVDETSIVFFCGKILFASVFTALAAFYLFQYSRPGTLSKPHPIKLAWPFVILVGLAGLTLAMTPSVEWHREILGEHWLECLLAIPLFAIVPFAVIILALRKGAPTELKWTGAIAGLVAGGLGSIAYSLHCIDDTIPFVAAWYGAAIIACGFIGALLGPRILRW